MTKPFRIRRKTDTTANDPAWVTSQIDPAFLRFTVASAEAGVFSVVLTPEDTATAALTISVTADGDDDEAAVAAALAARANVLAATSPGDNFLRPGANTNSGAVLALAIAPTAQPMVASVVDPGSASLTPEHTGVVPVVAKGTGEGSLSLVMSAVNSSGVPLAPGSGNANLQLVELVDRTEPRGPNGPQLTVGPSMVVARSVVGHPLNEPWIVPEPNGFYTVRIDTDASMPGGIAALEVHGRKVETPPVGDESVDSNAIVPGAVDPVHLAGGYRTVAANVAIALTRNDAYGHVAFSTSSAGSGIVITRDGLPAGAPVTLICTARDTNNVTLPVVGGTLTFDATGEIATVVWDGDAFRAINLQGATVV